MQSHRFKSLLPDLCSLMRSKVFPNSPFSDTDTATASRSSSPELLGDASLQISSSNLTSSMASSRSLNRVRSRSLSISLAQEREERERSVSIGPGKKRALNREVSMSRAFKPKPKPKAFKAVETTSNFQLNGNGKPQAGSVEIILVEDTPQKPRAVSRKASQSHCDPMSASNSISSTRQSNQGLFGIRTDKTDDDDAWMLDSSPDVFLLQPGRKVDGNLDDEYEAVTFQTPSRRPRRRD